MPYVGDYNLSTTFHHRFTTVNASGVPTTLGNSPSAEYYVDGGTTAFTAGLTLTADFATRTGLNSLAVICTASATGLTSGVNVSVQVAVGTVSGVSLVGYPIIEYSITRRSPLRPATANRTLLISSTGYAAVDWAAVGSPGSTVNLSDTTLFTATNVTNNVGAVVTAVNTITPARITAQGIDVGAIVTAVNTIVPARVTAQGIDIGAIVTAVNTITPARVTAQGIDIGAIVTAFNTIAPARVTAQGIDVGAIVTAINTIAAARVTVISASGLASMFLTDSGTTYASSVAGSPVQEIADNAGGTSLTVTAIASGVWDEILTGATHNIPTSAGRRLRILSGSSEAFSGTITGTPSTTVIRLAGSPSATDNFYRPGLIVVESSFGTQFRRISSYDGTTNDVTVSTAFETVPVSGDAVTIVPWASVRVSEIDAGVEVDANVQRINDVTIIGDGSTTPFNV